MDQTQAGRKLKGGNMKEKGWYYLHVNGQIFYKRYKPEADSPFVKRVWVFDSEDRGTLWKIILESLYLGADPDRVYELSAKWGFDFKDSLKMISRVIPTEDMTRGLQLFIERVLKMTTNDYWNKAGKEWKEIVYGETQKMDIGFDKNIM